MKNKLIVVLVLLVTSSFSLALETTTNATTNTAQVKSPTKAATQKAGVANKAETAPKKKKSFFAIFDVIGKVKEFVSGKSKQNGAAIEDAANGVFKAKAKRNAASSPQAKAIQEKLDKLQEERLKKYETND